MRCQIQLWLDINPPCSGLMIPDTHLGENIARQGCLMIKQCRTFFAEFKREASGYMFDQGYSHIEASRSLGAVESALLGWVSQL
ncbi:hypothetical protein ALO46_200122 [Pseudomonas syringae pv. solidagae]|nr:hypothetical protein ALO46_200122 [Pseudomonas syringae pv. solidagae]